MSKENLNPWKVYQHELKKSLGKYNREKAKRIWNDIAKQNDLGPFNNWEANDDVYKRIAYRIKKKHLEDNEVKNFHRSNEIRERKNDFNTFLNQNPGDSSVRANEYNKKITEKKNTEEKIIKKFTESDKKKSKYKVDRRDDFKTKLEKLLDIVSIEKVLNGNKNELDKECENIYNEAISCYIRGIQNKIQNKYPEKLPNRYIPNNYYKNPDNDNVTLYVTDNDLFEKMSREKAETTIIPNKDKAHMFGTLADNPTNFIVCYDSLLSLKEIYIKAGDETRRDIKNEIFKFFLHIGFRGYEFVNVPKLDDFFYNDKGNVYYLNLNNLQPYGGNKKELFTNKEHFRDFIQNNGTISFDEYDPDNKNMIKQIKDEKKDFGKNIKPNYTPLYIAGAALAALVAIGANDVYRSFTEKPNEFLKR